MEGGGWGGENRQLGQWGTEVRYQRIWLGEQKGGGEGNFTVTEMGEGAWTEPVINPAMFH